MKDGSWLSPSRICSAEQGPRESPLSCLSEMDLRLTTKPPTKRGITCLVRPILRPKMPPRLTFCTDYDHFWGKMIPGIPGGFRPKVFASDVVRHLRSSPPTSSSSPSPAPVCWSSTSFIILLTIDHVVKTHDRYCAWSRFKPRWRRCLLQRVVRGRQRIKYSVCTDRDIPSALSRDASASRVRAAKFHSSHLLCGVFFSGSI